MSLPVGNIKERSLTSIWEDSRILQQLRRGAYTGRCGACEYRDVCGGCRARALANTGELLGEDPLCAYVPSGGDAVPLADTLPTELVWEERAQERIKRIPVFMRGMITRMIETKARERGIGVITSELIDELKTQGSPGKH
jgi:hypothetical protein